MAAITDKASGSTRWVPNKLNVRRAVSAFWRLTLAGVGALLSIDQDEGSRLSIALHSIPSKVADLCLPEFVPAFDTARPAA